MRNETFSGTQAAKVVAISYRQLDYWARTDLVRPSGTDATGSGSRREYTYRDLLELKVIKNLLDAGIKLESIRDVLRHGQGVLNILPMSGVRDEIDRHIIELRPEPVLLDDNQEKPGTKAV